MKNDRLHHSAPPRGSLSGSNDDSSVLSLKALVAKADPTLSAAQAASLEDSGLIDLKKLMANAQSSADVLPPVLAPPLSDPLIEDEGLFAMPEITLVPHVASASNDAPTSETGGWAKWIGAATLMALVVAGTMGILHARAARVAELQSGVASAVPAAMPLVVSEPEKFVEELRPVDTAPLVANEEVPKATETKSPAATTHRSRQAVIRSPSRKQPAPKTTTATTNVEPKLPPPAPCDLMCEIQRAATKKKAP